MSNHAHVSSYRVSSGNLTDVVIQVRAELLQIMKYQHGFRRHSLAVTGPDVLVSLSVWETRLQAEQASRMFSEWASDVPNGAVAQTDSHLGEVVLLHERATATTPTIAVVLMHTPKPGAHDLTEKIRAEFLPVFDLQPGFNSFTRVRADGGATVTWVEWDSREDLARAQPTLSRWGDENVTPYMSDDRSQSGQIAWSVRHSVLSQT